VHYLGVLLVLSLGLLLSFFYTYNIFLDLSFCLKSLVSGLKGIRSSL
jgi:hypothetical protein